MTPQTADPPFDRRRSFRAPDAVRTVVRRQPDTTESANAPRLSVTPETPGIDGDELLRRLREAGL